MHQKRKNKVPLKRIEKCQFRNQYGSQLKYVTRRFHRIFANVCIKYNYDGMRKEEINQFGD